MLKESLCKSLRLGALHVQEWGQTAVDALARVIGMGIIMISGEGAATFLLHDASHRQSSELISLYVYLILAKLLLQLISVAWSCQGAMCCLCELK